MYYKVLVVIDKTPTTILKPEVLKPIINYPIWVNDRAPDFPRNKTISVNINRAITQQLIKNNLYLITYDYIFMLDSDCVIPENAIEIMLNEIKPNETLCIRTKADYNHVICSACLLSLKDYLSVNFNTEDCHCRHMPNPRYIDGLIGYELK